ncbi:MAG: hypothetical protein QOK17_1906 [Sphingomonadales bacterium]|jgi:hypothetical protein|nr:hypothetical protein [Sphingomonadales bacterium]
MATTATTASSASTAAPLWFRLIAGLGLIWNLFGVYAYLQAVGVLPGAPADMTSKAMPAWVVAAFAVAVFAGALGSLGLLVLKRWAKMLLALSLLAVLVNDLWAFMLHAGGEKQLVMPILVNLIAILLVWLAYWADRRGWLS